MQLSLVSETTWWSKQLPAKQEHCEKVLFQVQDSKEDTRFHNHALYKHGWSLFKTSEYKLAIIDFIKLRDRLGNKLEKNKSAEANILNHKFEYSTKTPKINPKISPRINEDGNKLRDTEMKIRKWK